VPCRACWAWITLDPDRFTIVDRRVVYSCQACGSSVLVRDDDAPKGLTAGSV
jgi:hypothetical protein